jgi:threonine synthase
MRQIQAYGANLVRVPGSRKDTSDAAHRAAQKIYYASHAHSPLFIEGCKTMAYELWEQMGGSLPGMVVTPLGQGSILLGLYQGFCQLVEDGYAQGLPALVGVQAEACAPVALAFQAGEERPRAVPEPGHTAAEGIKLSEPVRGEQVLKVLRTTGGGALAVSEEEILNAQTELAGCGFYVEPTSAVTLAGYRKLAQAIPGPVVLVLTGSGLKTAG